MPNIPVENMNAERARQVYDSNFQEEKKKRIFGIVILVLIAVAATAASFLLIWRVRPKPRFLFLTEEWLANEMELEALIIRDETVYDAPVTGLFRSFIPQGSKVAKSSQIGQIIPADSKDELRKLDKANNDVNERRYELLSEGRGGNAARVFEASEEAIRRNLHVFYDGLAEGRIAEIPEIELDLRLVIEQRLEDAKVFNFEDEDLKTLISQRDRLEEAALNDIRAINADASGIFVRQLDGLERELNPETALSMNVSELQKYLSKAGKLAVSEQVKAGDPLFKLLRSGEQYFVCYIPNKSLPMLADLQNVSSLRVYCPTNGIEIKQADIVRQEAGATGSVLVFSTRQNISAFASMRKAHLKIYLNEEQGLRVPKTALIDYQEGNVEAGIKSIEGGYVHQQNVRIISTNNEYALVESKEGSDFPLKVSTMILLNPQSMKEGEELAE